MEEVKKTAYESPEYPAEDRLVFLQEFLKHPLQIGSIIPSSRFLERRVIAAAGISSARTIIELGPGTGGITRAILRAMLPHARLLSIELNPHFHKLVSQIRDVRLNAHLGNALDLEEIMMFYDLNAPDVVISGIPFSTMPRHEGSQILENIANLLIPDGRFVAYQLSNRVASLCNPLLGTCKMETEFLNIPPMRIFQWQKKSG